MKTLKQLRMEHGLTQEELANMFGVTSRTIYSLEKDSSNIKEPILSKYIKAFNTKYDDIFLGNKYEIFEFENSKKLQIIKEIKRKIESV